MNTLQDVAAAGVSSPETAAERLDFGLGSRVPAVPQQEAARAEEFAPSEHEYDRPADSIRLLLHRAAGQLEETRRLRRLLASQSRALQRLKHECRSPLQSIFGISTLLLRGAEANLSEEQARLVRSIGKAADHLSELLEDADDPENLLAARARQAPLDAAGLLRTLQGMLPAPLIKPGVKLVFCEAGDMPLASDERKVLQILRNLVNNALKYTARGEVRVSVAQDSESRTVVFEVSDTGPGIDGEQQEKLAAYSARGEAAADGCESAGVGLPLCHALAAVLGGKIAFESVPGRGSKFRLVLPQGCADA